jgi:tetratricopeptide (TPR) repeat protein
MEKQLNIGCNIIYKPGFINIDASNDLLADVIASPYDLPYEDNSIDKIESINLIEQLTYEKLHSTLFEWYRVLKPGGQLVIETINAEEIITEYMKAEEIFVKNELLKTLYQSFEGYNIQSACLNFKLNELLNKAGFEEITDLLPKIKTFRENIRIQCSKSSINKTKMLLAKTNKQIVKAIDILNTSNKNIYQEFSSAIIDTLINEIISSAASTNLLNNSDFHKLTVYSPIIAKILINELLNEGMLNIEHYRHIDKVLDKLIATNFVTANYKMYYEIKKEPRDAINYYLQILDENGEFLADLFKTPENVVDKLLDTFYKQKAKKLDSFNIELNKEVYSFEHVKQHARILLNKAVKASLKEEFDTSYTLLLMAYDLNPEDVEIVANLGLLEAIEKRYSNALKYFNISQKLLENDVIQYHIGLTQYHLKHYKTVILSIINIPEDTPEKFILLGCAYYQINNLKEAIEAFRWATILSEAPAAYINLAKAYEKAGNLTETMNILKDTAVLKKNTALPEAPIPPLLRKIPFTIEELQVNINKILQTE